MTNKTTEPELAILDADIIVVRAACWADSKGANEEQLRERIAFDVNQWTPTFCTQHICAVSCKSADNFRLGIYPEYKANRKGKTPPVNLPLARDIMECEHPVVRRDRLEADDLMGLGMSSGLACAVSLDKDMLSVPGWLWNPDKMCFPMHIDQESADRNFVKQWLMGDTTDNIKGANKVGPVKAGKIVDESSYENLIPAALAEFERRGHDLEYALLQARLVRILRDGEYDRETGDITLWEPSFLD